VITLFLLLSKYKKYEIEYSNRTKELVLYKPISVREFLELKWDIYSNNLDVKNIVVTNRYICARAQF
jgi:hypothetical protein